MKWEFCEVYETYRYFDIYLLVMQSRWIIYYVNKNAQCILHVAELLCNMHTYVFEKAVLVKKTKKQ